MPPTGRVQWSRSADHVYVIDPQLNPLSIAPTLSSWLNIALEDLSFNSAHELRNFLRRAGADISAGRRAFEPLCKLFVCLREESNRADALADAINIVEGQFDPIEGDKARQMLLQRALEVATELDDRTLKFVINNLERIDFETFALQASALAKTLWYRDNEEFWRLMDRSERGRTIGQTAIQTLESRELIEQVSARIDRIGRLIDARPELLIDPLLWQVSKRPVDTPLRLLANHHEREGRALSAMIASGTPGLAKHAITFIDKAFVLSAVLSHLDAVDSEVLGSVDSEWIATATQDRELLAQYLAAGKVKRNTSLLAIAHVTDPDTVPNDFGDDTLADGYTHCGRKAIRIWNDVLRSLPVRARPWSAIT